jgi:hypothetical protein
MLNKEVQKVDWGKADVRVERAGKMIRLPAEPGPMPMKEAIAVLQKLDADETKEMEVIELIEGFPLDGAVAFMKAMKETFGWATSIDTPGFFGPKPPKMIGVETGPNETTQVIFGRFEIPGIPGYFETHVAADKNQHPCLAIVSKTQKRDAHLVKELAARTRHYIKTESIYKGKAIHVRLDEDGSLSMELPPAFIDTSKTNPEELILNADVLESVNTSVLTPIRHTQVCRDSKIPLKRGILLEGKYGVGKTLIAKLSAMVCVQNGWTFIMIDRPETLAAGLEFANRYAPSLVFVEDIDRATEERDDEANDILNTIDGILSKDAQVITVMTTNHVEKINQAMLRPGRLDAVITIQTPDAISVERLIRLYARDMLNPATTLQRVGVELEGQIPATIREVVERSKLRAIPRMVDGRFIVTEDDLLHAAKEMQMHLALLNRKADHEPSPGEMIEKGISLIVGGVGGSNGMEKIERISKNVTKIRQAVGA